MNKLFLSICVCVCECVCLCVSLFSQHKHLPEGRGGSERGDTTLLVLLKRDTPKTHTRDAHTQTGIEGKKSIRHRRVCVRVCACVCVCKRPKQTKRMSGKRRRGGGGGGGGGGGERKSGCEQNRKQRREMPVHKCFMAAEGGL